MNRAQRRAQGKPMGDAAARQQITQSMTDRISWTAAAFLLQRVVNDQAFGSMDADLRGGIARFLERHPAPVKHEPDKPG